MAYLADKTYVELSFIYCYILAWLKAAELVGAEVGTMKSGDAVAKCCESAANLAVAPLRKYYRKVRSLNGSCRHSFPHRTRR